MNSIHKLIDPDDAIGRVGVPTVARYIKALDRLKRVDPAYYREVMLQVTDPLSVVAEAVLPVATLPASQLTPGELAWRRLADAPHMQGDQA